MIGNIAINNINNYNSLMSKSLDDKLFFLKFLDNDIENLLDFGCANGALLKKIKELNIDLNLYGYDLDSTMIKIAKKNNKEILFDNNLNNITKLINLNKTCLILSSVIHEIYSYSTKEEIDKFWNICFSSNFKYISIRDMVINNSCIRKSNKNDINKIENIIKDNRLKDFENIHGSIANNKNLIHFLLKYKYIENWKREVKENYLPLTIEELLNKIPKNYEIIYKEEYILPFLKNEIKKDFNIDLKDNTHIKLILKRVND